MEFFLHEPYPGLYPVQAVAVARSGKLPESVEGVAAGEDESREDGVVGNDGEEERDKACEGGRKILANVGWVFLLIT